MRKALGALGVVVVLAQGSGFAQRKDCEELKKEIAAKLDAKGVTGYTLTIVAAAEVKSTDNVVGGCDGGTKKIVYTRG